MGRYQPRLAGKPQIGLVALILAVSLSGGRLWAGKKDTHVAGPQAQMEERRRVLHALNRLGFGPRPGDVDRVLAMGVEKWIDLQLHPERIDDSAVQARLAPYRTLNMSAQQMLENFPPGPVVQAVVRGQMPLPRDPLKRAIYQAQIQHLQDRQERKQGKAAALETAAQPRGSAGTMSGGEDEADRQARMYAESKFDDLINLPADARFATILNMTPRDRDNLLRYLRPMERQQLAHSLRPEQREAVLALTNPEQLVVNEVAQAKLLRAVYSERQLQEVMTDFWFNHFNVFIGKGADRYLTTEYERDVIRSHSLGKFKDLLAAAAKSPAMLFYLDNWDSVGPDSDFALGRPKPRRSPPGWRRRARFGGPWADGFPRPQQPQPRPPQNANRQKGLNENYARELMELHTLGVDGGYTQKDVQEVAKVFTGWTIKQPREGGTYFFDERRHQPGSKRVLGHKIKPKGEKEGMEVLDILAHHPSTARFICRKLAVRFISDTPPEELVNRMAQTFLHSDGNIREVLRTIFRSPEFWSETFYRAKVKTPLEFVASAIRASGADVQDAMPLVQVLNRMGMPLYGQQAPTGYPMNADAWVNSAALLNRMNFAIQLALGRMPGVNFDSAGVAGNPAPATPEHAIARLEDVLLGGDVSRQTHDTILKQMSDPQITGRVLDDPARPLNLGAVAGLVLGSPEFQRR